MTKDGRIPLVRQYRPAIEEFTFEFPGGIIDTAEDAEATAVRELLEETGFRTRFAHLLGVKTNDAGRLGNRVYSYFIEIEDRTPGFKPEEGVAIELVTVPQLAGMIVNGGFDAQAHLGTVTLAALHGYIEISKNALSSQTPRGD